MKIESPKFNALFTDELKTLSELFKKYNYELRIAGGPVRDLLMGIQPADIDFASVATPTEMKEMFEKEEIRMLHKKGEEHGTITCRINEKENFEITTLRIDLVCDGRRAEVQYTTDWEKDAFRRDLTINSLFLGLDGTVYDYTGGIEDVKERKVKFVGEAQQRIQEDYLRILRYFRFFGRIAKEPDSHDKETLETIIKNKDGIKHLSGERIWMELKKILVGRFASEVMKTMITDCDLSEYLALPSEFAKENIDEFRRVSESVKRLSSPSEETLPCTVLSTLLKDIDSVNEINLRLRISAKEKNLCEFLVEYREVAKKNKDNFVFFRNLVLETVHDYGKEADQPIKRIVIELLKYIEAGETLEKFRKWTEDPDTFTVFGLTLLKAGVPKGPNMKNVLKHLNNLWIQSDCKLTEEELIEHAKTDTIPESKTNFRIRKRKWSQI